MRVTGEHWRSLANDAGLDPERVADVVTSVSEGILEHVDDTLGEHDLPHRASALDEMRRYNERVLRGFSAPTRPSSRDQDATGRGSWPTA